MWLNAIWRWFLNLVFDSRCVWACWGLCEYFIRFSISLLSRKSSTHRMLLWCFNGSMKNGIGVLEKFVNFVLKKCTSSVHMFYSCYRMTDVFPVRHLNFSCTDPDISYTKAAGEASYGEFAYHGDISYELVLSMCFCLPPVVVSQLTWLMMFNCKTTNSNQLYN